MIARSSTLRGSTSSSAESPNELVDVRRIHVLYSRRQPIDEGEEMCRAFMSTKEGVTTYLEDMTCYEHFEPGDRSACRRR